MDKRPTKTEPTAAEVIKTELDKMRADFRAERATLLQTLDLYRQRQDWHGVMDMAADLREVDAKLAVLK